MFKSVCVEYVHVFDSQEEKLIKILFTKILNFSKDESEKRFHKMLSAQNWKSFSPS